MPDHTAPEIELLRAAYAAFNARDIDAALALMSPDVAWPRAFKGGFVRGHEEVRAYWRQQWSEIDPHVEPMAFHPDGAEHILVDVHQVVRDLAGAVELLRGRVALSFYGFPGDAFVFQRSASEPSGLLGIGVVAAVGCADAA